MSNHFDIRRVGIAYIIILEYKLHRLHKSSTPELYLFGNAICTRVWIVSIQPVTPVPRSPTQFVRGYELWDRWAYRHLYKILTQFVRGYELWERDRAQLWRDQETQFVRGYELWAGSHTPQSTRCGNAICTRVWIVRRRKRPETRERINAICTRVWIVRG